MKKSTLTSLKSLSDPAVSLVLDQIDDQVKVLDPDLTVIRVNQAAREIIPENTVLEGRKCYEIFRGKTEPCDGCPVQEALREGKMNRNILSDEDASIWYEITAYPLFGEDSKVLGVIEMVKDITLSRTKDQELENQKKRYYQIFHESNDPMFVNLLGADGTIGNFVEVNDQGCLFLGYEREELLERSPLDVIDTSDMDKLMGEFRHLQDQGYALWETLAVTRDGENRPVELNCRIFDLDGRRSVLSVVRDISERKSVEQALWESENRYSALFQNNHAVMLLIDPETGKIKDANPAACKYYGFEMDELLSKFINEINILDRDQVFQEMDRARMEERKHFYFRHRLASGDIRDVEVYSGPIQMGSKRYLYSIIHDITERRKAEEETRRLNNKLLLMSRLDELTAVFNRRYFEETLIFEIDKARRYQTSLSLIMFDLDNFKEINDSLGHIAGDRVLKRVAQAVQGAIRTSDLLSRWGGDEFMILTPVRMPSAMKLAEKVRLLIENLECGVTASFGVVEYCRDDTVDDLMKRVDKALYNAKQKGRNTLGQCVFIAQ